MSPSKPFRDRVDAGRKLAARLRPYRASSPIVLGLPRGGVPVAYEVARALDAPLDVCVVRKLGAPSQPELGIGAVSEEGTMYVDRVLAAAVGVSTEELSALAARKRAEVDERVAKFRRGAPPLEVRGKTVLVVDDGIATGGTARAALQALRSRGAGRLVLAVPVGASDTIASLSTVADELVCLRSEEDFVAVGLWYEDFSATTDDEVVELLDRARAERVARTRARSDRVPLPVERAVTLHAEGVDFTASLALPRAPRGLALIAHEREGSWSEVVGAQLARELQRSGFATLLIEPKPLAEELASLAARLAGATDWASVEPELADVPLAYVGVGGAGAAVLIAAATRPDHVRAVVCVGARPERAEASLGDVAAPTLLLVGSADPEGLQLGRESGYFMGCETSLEVVPGASRALAEPGAVEHAAQAASRWLERHLPRRALERALA